MMIYKDFMNKIYPQMTSNKFQVILQGKKLGFLLEPDQYYLCNWFRLHIHFIDDFYPVNITSLIKCFRNNDLKSLDLSYNQKYYFHDSFKNIYEKDTFKIDKNDVIKIVNNSPIELPDDYTLDDILDILDRFFPIGKMSYDIIGKNYYLDFDINTSYTDDVDRVIEDKVYNIEVINYDSNMRHPDILLNGRYWYYDLVPEFYIEIT